MGRQELEIRVGDDRKFFSTSKFGTIAEVKKCDDPSGLEVFWYFIQDIKCFALSLINAHYRVSRANTGYDSYNHSVLA